jgi:serine/threonine protein kinase KIN1/2
MSTAATSSASPSVVRSHSPHGQQLHATSPAGLPTRTRSTAARPSSSSHHPHRTSSRTYAHDAPPTANQAALNNVAQRDFETANIARPLSSRRSSSRDGQRDARPETSRSRHRTSSRPGSSRNSTEMAGAHNVITNGGYALDEQTTSTTTHPDLSSAGPIPSSGRRRTSIPTSTGTWLLGKTIGQGSMGKVKIAKNAETGEQVGDL